MNRYSAEMEICLKHAFEQLKKVPKHCIRPKPGRIMRMFRIMPPESIRVFIMAQDPYPNSCLLTMTHHAYGIAFYNNPESIKVPKTLNTLIEEAQRDEGNILELEPNAMLRFWMSQGVFLTNAALTTAVGCERYLHDHGMIWEGFMRNFIGYLHSMNPDIVFVFFGV